MTRSDPNNVTWFLMGDFLRLSPWSKGLGRQAQAVLTRFEANYESYAQDVEKAILTAGASEFDILLVFRTPQLHGDLVCEWYSFFYPMECGNTKHK